MIFEYCVDPNKITRYNQPKEIRLVDQPQPIEYNDLNSFTSNLKGYDFTSFNFNAISLQDDPIKVLEESFSKNTSNEIVDLSPPENVVQPPPNSPDITIEPFSSPLKSQLNKQVLPRSSKHDSPQKPKKRLKTSRNH
ncbi:hypothetical protein ACTFIW_008718 [Dictyostelium discoideum]